MANSKAISIRIPDELLEKIDLLAEDKYKSHKGTPNRSLVVLDAIVAYFDTLSDTSRSNDIVSVSDNVSTADFQSLREEFDILKSAVKYLTEKLFTVADTVSKPDVRQPEQSQLSIIPVSDNADNSNGGTDKGLTAAQLADRLGKKQGDVTTKKFQTKDNPSKFIEWVRKLDPDGWEWEFREEKGKRGKYFPIKPLA
jgi:predicted DNA-binding protein